MIQVDSSVPLQGLNTLALPASARGFARVHNDDELAQALQWARERDMDVMPLGQGSNVVLAGDVDALVVQQCCLGIRELQRDERHVHLRVAAGQNWHELVRWSVGEGFGGLENLALIPGTVGAAPIQNIGAYGMELAACLERVHAISVAEGSIVSLARDECRLGYRDSIFKGELRDEYFITAVDLRLGLGGQVDTRYPVLEDYIRERGIEAATPQQVFDAVVAIRSERLPDPSAEPNAGSFFKNPVVSADKADTLRGGFPGLPMYPQSDGRIKLPAAWLIQHCGFKGERRGAVGVHVKHALVLVHFGGGDGEQLLALAQEIATAVYKTFGIALEIEPRIYGSGQ